MFRRLISILAFAAVTVCAGAEGYKVAFKTENTIVFATITQDANSDKSLADAVSEVNNYADYQGNPVSVHETTIVGSISDDDMAALSGLTSVRINLSEAVCDISKLQKGNANYIILPDRLSKDEVNEIGTNFNAVASKKAVTEKQTKWVYDNDVIYEGQPVESNGVYTGTVKATVELTKTSESYQMNGSEYNGKVFVDDKGTCYGISDENQLVELTVEQGYTYNNYGTTVKYTGEVAEVEGKYYGVVNPSEVHELTYDQEVTYTYTNGNNKCAWLGNVYNNGAFVFFTGGKEYEVTTSNFYTYYNNGNNIFEGDLTRTDANGNVYGNVGGEKVSLTEEEAYYYDNGTQLYTGATRQDAVGNLYGNTGTPVNLIIKEGFVDNNNQVFTGLFRQDGNTYYGVSGTQKTISREQNAYTYTDNYSNTYIYDSGYITKDNKGNVGGTFYEMHTVVKDELYFYYDAGFSCYYDGEVTEEGGNYTGIIDGQTVYLYKYDKNTLNYYINNERNIIYEGDIYYKGETPYACLYGSPYPLTEAENVMYYEDNGKKIVYTGHIYRSQDTNDTNEYGVIWFNEWEIKKATLYYYNETRYTGNIYYDAEDNIIGFINSYEVQLTKGIRYYYTDAQSNKVTYSGSIYTQDTNIFGFIGGTEYQLTYQENGKYYIDENGEKIICSNGVNYTLISIDGKYAYVGGTATALTVNDPALICNTYTDNNGRTVIYEGRIYGGNTAYIGGTEVELTYGDIYMNGENMYTGYRTSDNKYGYTGSFTQLTTNFTYTYTDPTDGTEKVHTSTSYLETLDVDRTVTLTSKEVDVPTGKLHLTAYVSVPGSLRKTLEYWGALGNNTVYHFGVGNVTELTISGDLKGSDIANGNNFINEEGHALIYNGSVQAEGQTSATGSIAAISGATLTYIDLKDAVFETQTDMNLQLLASGNSIKTVILPVSEKMTLIPDNCMNNFSQLTELCIPYNFEEIGSAAFYNTGISHIYTTDPNEDIIVDHGDSTLTFSANLKWIHSKDPGGHVTFFGGGMDKVKEVYVLAEKAPKCDAYSFQGPMTCGNNGFAGNLSHPIGRHNYVNSQKQISVLHYPTSCTTEEAQNYTDITRKYTLVDEVGGIDGRGKSLMWPRHAEFWRSYQQAINGYIWGAWREYPDNGVTTEVISELATAKQYGINESLTYNKEDYQGWHEFVLVGNNNTRDFDPQEENTQFVQRDWYTLCVPYDLTKSQLLATLGIKANTGGGTNYVTMLKGDEVTVEEDLYPDVRTLTHVSRSMNRKMVTLHLSKPLLNNSDGNNYDVVITEETGQGFEYNTLEGDDPVVMRGGHPYLVKCYIPTEWNEKIKNLGMYIMAVAESANHAATEAGKEAPYKFGDCTVQATGGSIMLPCIKHKIHALNADSEEDATTEYRYTYEDTNKETPALYHFIGTYAQEMVPQYGYYLGKSKSTGEHKFFRTTKTTTSWNPYSAVIVGLSDPEYENLDGTLTNQGGNFSDVSIKANNDNDLIILAGETDDPSLAGKALTLDFDKGADEGTTDGIVDVEAVRPTVKDNKVYNLNGVYVGDNLYDLPKGIYIVNGMKHVVR
ncbi:MAG: leucine-rich repeat protein [Prevotella sp.]|nr:leucine-rich repeat protein [Prevotella sp.]